MANQTQNQAQLTDGSFIENLADVMSDSSQNSNADPDLHPQPNSESQISEIPINPKSPDRFLQMQEKERQENELNMHLQSQSEMGQSQKQSKTGNSTSQDKFNINQKVRPQSAITNYTSNQSGIKTKSQK